MADLLMGDLEDRRRILASRLGEALHGVALAEVEAEAWIGDPLNAGRLHERYRLCELIWLPVAQVMQETADWGCLDHCWWFGFPGGEPWGFVTEPYWEEAQARAFAVVMRKRLRGWGLVWWTGCKAESPWNPGGTVPIAVSFERGTRGNALSQHACRYLADRLGAQP